MVERISRDTPRFKNELDAVVFICKTFWMHAFNKQVDNLKTNHQVRKKPPKEEHMARAIPFPHFDRLVAMTTLSCYTIVAIASEVLFPTPLVLKVFFWGCGEGLEQCATICKHAEFQHTRPFKSIWLYCCIHRIHMCYMTTASDFWLTCPTVDSTRTKHQQ